MEPTKVYQPSYVSINSEAEEKNVSIWHVSPAETVSALNSWFLPTYTIMVYIVLFKRDSEFIGLCTEGDTRVELYGILHQRHQVGLSLLFHFLFIEIKDCTFSVCSKHTDL